MSQRRKKNRRHKAEEASASAKAPPATPEHSSALRNEGAKPLRIRLGAFAVVLGTQLLLLGFFYAMAGAFPAEARLKTLKPSFSAEAGKTVAVTAHIRYAFPPMLRSRPSHMVFRINLDGQAPVNWDVELATLVKVGITAPEKPGVHSFTLIADPDGSAGIGPLKTTAALNVLASKKPAGD